MISLPRCVVARNCLCMESCHFRTTLGWPVISTVPLKRMERLPELFPLGDVLSVLLVEYSLWPKGCVRVETTMERIIHERLSSAAQGAISLTVVRLQRL